ncbi:hypothetical protein FRC00_006650 [Tulasnella sp. 408]|nr:hypothetical protein FRC00_006650 [Tulasnella sp. 408]
MSSWATFTSSFTSPSSIGFPLSSPPTLTHTHPCDAYHQVGRPESLPQRRYPQVGDQGRPLQGNNADYDYQHLQRLVNLRESKLADCSYLTRQRKKPHSNIVTSAKQASVSEATPVQHNPTPPINSASDHVLQPGRIISRHAHKVAKAPTGLGEGLGYTFQGEKPPQFSAFNALDSFKSPWGKHVVTDDVGTQFDRNDGLGRFHFPQASPAEYSSSESATDSESDSQAFWADFTWSFPISREERRAGVRSSAYSFDENGKLQGL